MAANFAAQSGKKLQFLAITVQVTRLNDFEAISVYYSVLSDVHRTSLDIAMVVEAMRRTIHYMSQMQG